MNTLLNPFRAPSRKGTEWFSVGLASSFPDVGLDESELRLCANHGAAAQPGCKVFYAPKTDSPQPTEVGIPTDDVTQDLTDQVLVFQYRGNFHAIDHQCPHFSYPLSQGIPFDIEDFGIVLSAGLTCPKHNWSFDLFSGRSDRGNYRLKVWEVQLRELGETQGEDKEVWVRRKPRIG
ncbi:Rieske domain-containing protein [Madurella fahalii]|uniref:Rieske domain-containing protein n=1 Tax=Madurella fahalii TaxID=1157608 RepID=A0ABQ0GJP5_9PEZI